MTFLLSLIEIISRIIIICLWIRVVNYWCIYYFRSSQIVVIRCGNEFISILRH